MIDSHCHIAGEEFAGDLAAVVERAQAAGLSGALCILAAGDAAESARAVGVRRAWPAVRFATGVHPHHAGEFAGRVDEGGACVLAGLAAERACAVGEIGLDYHYDFSPRDVQQEMFRAQVRLAREVNLPVIVHTREATDDTFAILAEEPGVRGVFHCFTGDTAMARRALDIGFFVSFAGILTFPRAESLRDAARVVPLDRVLAETDSPYLAPIPHRGKRNEPAYVVRVIDALAGLHGLDRDAAAGHIVANFAALFDK